MYSVPRLNLRGTEMHQSKFQTAESASDAILHNSGQRRYKAQSRIVSPSCHHLIQSTKQVKSVRLVVHVAKGKGKDSISSPSTEV